jgi:steroid delta-isomerase-like uncharacterized protein
MRPPRFHLLPTLAIAAGLFAAAPALAQECPTPTPEELEAIAIAYFDAFNKGDRDALDALLADDYNQPQGAIMAQGRDLHLERLGAVRSGFPDGVYTIDWMIPAGDKVAIRNTFRGTHQGEFAGVPASGNKVSIGAFHLHRIACGKIAETWNVGDTLGLFHQMGALELPFTTAPDDEAPASQPPKMAECPATTPDENIALARRWYDEALNQQKAEVFGEILWPNAVHHPGVFPDALGAEAIATSLGQLAAAFPDLRYTVDEVIADDDRVLVRWSGKGNHTGVKFLGVETSGKPVEWNGMNAFRFQCGRIIESWSETNGLSALRQLGGFE